MKYQHCVLLPISLVLIGAGLVTLLLFGIGNLEPYTHTKDFRTATCTVLQSNITGTVPCKHYDSSDPHKPIHTSTYPCLAIRVNYTEHVTQYDILDYEDDHEDEEELVPVEFVTVPYDINTTEDVISDLVVRRLSVTQDKEDEALVTVMDVMLYDSYESWTIQRTGGTNASCTRYICHEGAQENKEDVNEFLNDYGTVGFNFRCYFNPKNTAEVFADVVSGNSVMHALVWPALAMGFGLFLLVVVAFLSCEVWICRNPKRAQRRMQGQTYELASYRQHEHGQEMSRHGWREGSRSREGTPRTKRRDGDGNNNSRLPNLSAAADIIRKWSYRGRSDRHSSSSGNKTPTDTNKSSCSYGGEGSRQYSLPKPAERQFSTT